MTALFTDDFFVRSSRTVAPGAYLVLMAFFTGRRLPAVPYTGQPAPTDAGR